MNADPTYLPKSCTRSPLLWMCRVLLCLLATISLSHRALASEEDPAGPYDEILIYLNVQGVGGTQVSAAIRNDMAYLSITDVLDFLKIRNIASAGMDSISGFFIQQQFPYLIDKKNSRIYYQGKVFVLPQDAIIRTGNNLFLRSDYLGKVFGLTCKFNFRTLSVILTTLLELPVIRELRLETMRNNINRLKGDAQADTTIGAEHHFFRLGMADWALIAVQQTQSGQAEVDNDRLSLAVGGVLAGGELDLGLNYQNQTPLSERMQYYQWRYVDNNNPMLRQTMLGKIFTPTIASIYSPMVGVQFTNTPTTYRRSFGEYTLTYYCEATWVVELYVNNTLVDYAKPEVTGFSTFKVPLVYGNSVVKLKFYSPYGEERSSQQNIQIPFNFLPVHEWEYTASSGIVEDSVSSRFARAVVNYGISKRFTAGGGVEYLSSISSGKLIPFVAASYRISSNLLVAGEYAYGVRSRLLATYHLPSDLQFELSYIRYKQGQTAINNFYREERKVVLSFPFRRKKFTVFSRMSLYQVILPGTKYMTAEGLLAGNLFGVNTSFTTYAFFTDPASPYVYSNLSLAIRLPAKLVLSPQAQYEYASHRLIDMKCELGKFMNSRGYLNVFYEKNVKSQFESIGIAFRYDLPMTLMGLSVTHGNSGTALVESASGSMLYDDRKKNLAFNNRSNVGKGGILVQPFLDINGNGRRDKGEPNVAGVGVHINGGRMEFDKTDSSIRIYELEAYASYLIRLDETFENVAWTIRDKTIRIVIDPNQLKELDVPVSIQTEVSGDIVLESDGAMQPLERMVVHIYSADGSLVGRAGTEKDGSFDYSGVLPPGVYTVGVDPAQLWKLRMYSKTGTLTFRVGPVLTGDPVEGLRLVLRNKQ